MFICETLWVCLVYEKCYMNKVALPCLAFTSRDSERRPSAVMTLSTKMAAYFLCICNTLVILMLILNDLTHLITLLLYSGHQFMYCTVLLCMQFNVMLCLLFSSWFAKEANVANNKQWLANFMTQSQKNGNAISALRAEINSQVQLGRLVSKASGSHQQCSLLINPR